MQVGAHRECTYTPTYQKSKMLPYVNFLVSCFYVDLSVQGLWGWGEGHGGEVIPEQSTSCLQANPRTLLYSYTQINSWTMTTLTQMCHCYGNSMPNTQHITAVPYTYTTSYIQYMNNKKNTYWHTIHSQRVALISLNGRENQAFIFNFPVNPDSTLHVYLLSW